MNKQEIINELNTHHTTFFTAVNAFGQDKANVSANGKWSPAEHLEHIRKSIKPLAMGLGLPKLVIATVAGKAKRPSVSYDEVVANYKSKLSAGAVATGAYVPKTEIYKPIELTAKTNAVLADLANKINSWKEEDLDKYNLPHPLLGKITVREMLYFTIYHVQHHAMLLKRDYSS